MINKNGWNKISVAIFTGVFSFACYGLDTGNENPADNADRFKFEDFHKEKTAAPVSAATPADKTFAKGDVIKVREAYKLGNDPALRSIPSLYEASEALEKQLNTRCPNGWIKEQEWRKPEGTSFYIYYQASCL